MAYIGPFTPEYRLSLYTQWSQLIKDNSIFLTPGVNLVKVLNDPLQFRGWYQCSLPTDTQSTENAIVISKSKRWPLMIDP